MRGQRGEPGIGKRVIVADWLKRCKVLVHLRDTTSRSEKRRMSPRRRCRRGSKEEEVGGARLEIRSMAKKARERLHDIKHVREEKKYEAKEQGAEK
jgi:hypothetical protein